MVERINNRQNIDKRGRLNEEERKNRDRQKQKLEAFYLSGGNYEYVFGGRDVSLGVESQKEAHRMIRRGEVSRNLEDQLLRRIKGPMTTEEGAERVYEEIRTDGHMKRILGYLSAGNEGWNTARIAPEDLTIFYRENPTPMYFEEKSRELLDVIRRTQSEKKYREYEQSMNDFKMTIYGKKQEYFEAMKELHEEAENLGTKWDAIGTETQLLGEYRGYKAEIRKAEERRAGESRESLAARDRNYRPEVMANVNKRSREKNRWVGERVLGFLNRK